MKLEKSETKCGQEFRALAETAPDSIARVDTELRRIYVNPAVKRTTSIPRTHLLEKQTENGGMPENFIPL